MLLSILYWTTWGIRFENIETQVVVQPTGIKVKISPLSYEMTFHDLLNFLHHVHLYYLMCRIENNYIPTEYEKIAEYINTAIVLEYTSDQYIVKTTQAVLESIEVFNNAEYLVLDNL